MRAPRLLPKLSVHLLIGRSNGNNWCWYYITSSSFGENVLVPTYLIQYAKERTFFCPCSLSTCTLLITNFLNILRALKKIFALIQCSSFFVYLTSWLHWWNQIGEPLFSDPCCGSSPSILDSTVVQALHSKFSFDDSSAIPSLFKLFTLPEWKTWVHYIQLPKEFAWNWKTLALATLKHISLSLENINCSLGWVFADCSRISRGCNYMFRTTTSTRFRNWDAVHSPQYCMACNCCSLNIFAWVYSFYIMQQH